MLRLRAPAFIFAAIAAGSVSALSSITNLTVVNEVIAPDGYSRLWVFRHCCQRYYVLLSGIFHSATLADGKFPGPLITATKVS